MEDGQKPNRASAASRAEEDREPAQTVAMRGPKEQMRCERARAKRAKEEIERGKIEVAIADAEAKRARAEAERIEAHSRQERQRQRERDKNRRRKLLRCVPLPLRIGIPIALVVVLVVAVGIVLPLAINPNEPQYVTEASLKEAVAISDLEVAECTYKGIAEKKGQFLWMDTVDYRVKYVAKARASYNLFEIEFAVDEASRKITAFLPEPMLSEPIPDENSFGYLPDSTNADLREVLTLCTEDAAAEMGVNQLRDEARISVEEIIEALTKPLIPDDWDIVFEDLSENPNTGNAGEARVDSAVGENVETAEAGEAEVQNEAL